MSAAHPPGPRGHFLWGTTYDFRADRIGFVTSVAREYGDIVSLMFGPYRVYYVNHPDLVHEVLVKQASKMHKDRMTKIVLGRFLGAGLLASDGEFWKRQRKLEQPAFHAKRISAYADTMVNYGQQEIAGWRDGARLDLDERMMALTLRIVAKTLFDAEVADDSAEVGAALTTILRISNSMTGSFFMPLPVWVPTPNNRRERQAIAKLDAIMGRIIQARRASREDTGDLLSMLLLAQDEDGASMNDKQVRDEAMTLFLAGHETTANALTWTFYLLSQNPAVEARLHAELDAALAGRAPALADLPKLPYTEMVVKEALRLYPPAWMLGRETIEPVTLGGYTVRKGTPILLSPYVLHRDPRWWDEPESFCPERFSPENEARIPRYAYIPFGSGPRVCIGNQFAMMEAQLLLATIAQRFRLALVPGHPIELEPLITLRSLHGMAMTVHARSEAAQSAPAAAARLPA